MSAPTGSGTFIVAVSGSHSDRPHSLRHLWAGVQQVTDTSAGKRYQQNLSRSRLGSTPRNANKWTASDSRLRMCGYRDRVVTLIVMGKKSPIWRGLLHYFITVWRTVLLEELTVPTLVKKFPAFYGTRRFITTFVTARHLSLIWATSIQSITLIPLSEDPS